MNLSAPLPSLHISRRTVFQDKFDPELNTSSGNRNYDREFSTQTGIQLPRDDDDGNKALFSFEGS